MNIENPWYGKRVLITGCCGTVGKELLRQILPNGPSEILGLDNNESELFFITEEYKSTVSTNFYLGDMRDRDTLSSMMRGVDVVLHTAGLKHVIVCEKSPRDPIQTNILGTQNVIDAALANNVERVLFTSSDKAVNPTNVMGTSKLMGERLMTAADAHQRGKGTIFASTRFGNVLGSRGSVIPIFQQQIAEGGPLTLTDPEMTRFIMTLSQAVRLVMESTFMAKGGEVFVTKMPVVRIIDLARAMINILAPQYGYAPDEIDMVEIGSKPGEKLYEELMNDEEVRRTVELERYFAVLPAFRSVYEDVNYDYADMYDTDVTNPYNSSVEETMSLDEVHQYLLEHKVLEESIKVTAMTSAAGETDASIDNGRGRVSGVAHRHGVRG